MNYKRTTLPDPRYLKPSWAVQQIWRGNGPFDMYTLVEDICKHGVGHPNRGYLIINDPDGKLMLGIHGCDGCCSGRENG